MGRPLTGSRRFYQGRWWVSVPVARGSTRRRHESFVTEDDARTWQTHAVAALRNHQPIPDLDRYRAHQPGRRRKPTGPPQPAKIQADVASVARAWMNAAYDDLRRGGPERAERVRRIIDGYLVPWFAPRTTTISDVTYLMAHDWLLHLVGRTPSSSRKTGTGRNQTTGHVALPVGSEDDEEVGLARAAELAGVSLPTVRRRWRAGQLPGAYRNPAGHIRVPATTVAAITTANKKKTAVAGGLSKGYVNDALWVLRRVLAFARANGLFPPGFDPTEGLDAPHPDKTARHQAAQTEQVRPLTLPECARLASHLHPVHQLAFWLQRIMGLRISEAFGIRVADIVDHGDTGLLAVQGQGGRTFNVRDDHGHIVAVPHKTTTKTSAGSRVLVVPPKLMDVIRVAVDAFHTDPDTGHVDTDARLVPGIHIPDRSGQHAYRHAFDEAATAEHLTSQHLGFRVSTHLLRKSCATDLAWTAGIEDAVRRRFMGHRAGDDVYGRIYTLDHPDVAPLAKIAEILDHNIALTIGTLLTPTLRHVHWGTKHPAAARADHVDATLTAAGWLVDPGHTDDPFCDTNRVAAELDIYPTTARRWMTDGTLPTVTHPDAAGISRRFARLSDVWAHRDRLAGRILLPDIANELGVPYHEAYHALRRLELRTERGRGGEYYLTAEAAEALRTEHQRILALRRRSMKLATAARKLRAALSTVAVLSRTGVLEVDPETDSSGARFVTRVSVDEAWLDRRSEHPSGRADATIAVAEVARFTSQAIGAIKALIDAGLLDLAPARRGQAVTVSSLRCWLRERPDRCYFDE